jgi:Cu(I)/Ag(I) efflux system membrane protein CusA/SilA
MSLAGIAIAIGTMVDMGIIVLENIYDDLAKWEQQGSPGGEQQRKTVLLHAASQVVPAVLTAVSTTIISFLPVFFLTGRDGRLFTPMAWTKTFALAASLLVAVVAVPMLCHLFLRSRPANRWRSLLAAVSLALLAGTTTFFVWGEHLAAHAPAWYSYYLGATLPLDRVAVILAFALGWFAGLLVVSERLRPLEENPVSRLMLWLYAGRLRLALNQKLLMLSFPLLLVGLGLGAWFGWPRVLQPLERVAQWAGADLNKVPGYSEAKHTLLGLRSSDWIALDEGSWFYMPSLYPGATFGQTFEILQKQDVLLSQIPEVENVLGKIGRAESALDPAPVTMIETYVMLRPRDQWRPGVTSQAIWDEINRVATLPGVTPASKLQPIEGRVVMLQAGIRAAMAVRIYGESLSGLGDAAQAIASRLRDHPAVNPKTVSPDIVLGKPYLEFTVDRNAAARYGMNAMQVNQWIAAGLGGMEATTTVEGRQRYAVQVRFNRQTRENIDDLGRLSVVTPTGEVVPLDRLVQTETTWGPMGINSENARLVAHVSFTPSGMLGPIETADAIYRSLQTERQSGKLILPVENLELEMVGSFQNQVEANRRLLWIIPLVILINLLLHYLHFRDLALSLVVFSGIPVAAAGGMLAAAVMDVEMNTAMWIGFIALFGLAADDGIVMATYIRDVLRGRTLQSIAEIRERIYAAGLKRIRPCVMTTLTTLVALLPILLSDGRGADVARTMAIPIFGGMLAEPLSTFVVPTLYCWYLEWKFKWNSPADFIAVPND